MWDINNINGYQMLVCNLYESFCIHDRGGTITKDGEFYNVTYYTYDYLSPPIPTLYPPGTKFVGTGDCSLSRTSVLAEWVSNSTDSMTMVGSCA